MYCEIEPPPDIPIEKFPTVTIKNGWVGQMVRIKPFKTRKEASAVCHKAGVRDSGFVSNIRKQAARGVLFEIVASGSAGVEIQVTNEANVKGSRSWTTPIEWLYPADWLMQCSCVIGLRQGCVCGFFSKEMRDSGKKWNPVLRTWYD